VFSSPLIIHHPSTSHPSFQGVLVGAGSLWNPTTTTTRGGGQNGTYSLQSLKTLPLSKTQVKNNTKTTSQEALLSCLLSLVSRLFLYNMVVNVLNILQSHFLSQKNTTNNEIKEGLVEKLFSSEGI
jgi:hypothetical protein